VESGEAVHPDLSTLAFGLSTFVGQHQDEAERVHRQRTIS
jgi:hypothetical protein